MERFLFHVKVVYFPRELLYIARSEEKRNTFAQILSDRREVILAGCFSL